MSKNMMKNVGKRSLAMLLVMLMLAAFVPQAALAAQITSGSGTWVSGKLTYSYSVESEGSSENGAAGSVTVSGSTLTVKAVSSKAVSSGCSDTDAYPTTTTVTVTNVSSYPLKINSLNASGATVAGANVGDTLPVGATFTITITASPNSAEDTSSRTATGTVSISVSEETTATITAVSSPYVSYTLNGHQVAQGGSDVSFTADIGTTIELPSITAPEGYTFKGWRVGSNPITTASSFKVNGSCSVYPVILKGNVVEANYFKVGNNYYSYWEDAMGAAASGSSKKVIVNLNVTLPDSLEANLMTASGGTYVKPGANGGVEYIVPAGVTLVVPFDDAATTYTTTPAVVYGSHTNPTAFRTLTMPNKTSITVQNGGAICCSGKLSSSGQMGGWNGTPTGPDGRINMQGGSKITLNSGANLYCWGYIYGAGQVEAQSGSTVYEAFQIKDWRGGTATSNIYKYAFIFNQYYVQNIEVPLTFYAGAKENLYSSVNASSSAYPISATFIGSGGMFTISSGYIVKDYIESTDRLHVAVYGDISMSSMTISGIPMIGSISTADYILPITSNIGVDIHSGTTSITQTMELLPGVEINIDKGAELKINSGKKVYVYDNDDWLNFSGSTRMYPIGYSVANGTTAVRNASSLKDAKINVNGALTVAGSLFTSNGGANITSSEGTEGSNGKIVFTTAPTASTTIYEMENNSTKTSVIFYAPHFYNGDETYSDSTSTGTSTWYYDKDGEHWYRFLVDFVYNGKTVARDYFCENGQTLTYDASWLTNLGASKTSGSASVAVSGTNVNVSNVTANSVVTLTGTAATFIPTFVLNETQYRNYQNFTGNTLTETRTINGETWYVVKKADAAMAVGAEFAAPTDTEMGVTANAHNGVVWNLSGISAASGNAYGGFVPVGETAGGETYIFGFYTGAVAYNSATDAYYSTLAAAMEDIPAGGTATITMLANCGSFEEESRTASFAIVSGTTVTIDLNGHTAWGRLINGGDLTLELNGGTWDYHSGATAAASAYRAVSAISNTGNLTVQDTVGGGKITTDIASENGAANNASVIRNDGGSASIGAVHLEMTQMLNTNNAVVMNYNGGTMSMTGTALLSGYGYCVFNYGGTISSISGVTMTGSYGINNRNMRGSNTLANGYNVSKVGTITTIDNCTIDVGQYAIYNGGIITTLSNSTLTAHPDSAQVDTLGNGSAARHGNVQCYTVFNSSVWWYDTNVWKRVDVTSGSFSRTDDYKEDQSCRPTIGTITNCKIYAENTSTSADHGCALYNNGGVIGSISGGEIKTYKHPDNAKSIASNYALRNTAGGVINSISGVTISATGHSAVYNDGQFTTRTYNSYGDKIGGVQLHNTTTYGGASTIGSLNGKTISAGSYYAVMNSGYIGSITGGSISANYNALLNSGSGALASYDYARSYGSNTDATTETRRVETYVRNMETGGVIGSISGVSFVGTGTNSYYLLQNQGYIGTLSDSDFSAATPRAGEGYAMLLNGDSRQSGYTLTREPYAYESLYITPYEYHYDYAVPTIDVINGITLNKNATFAFRNLGQINSLKNSSFTGTQYVLVNATSGPYVSRDYVRYYSGTTKFATTKNNGSDLLISYTRIPAEIGVLDNNTITGTSTYALYNGGHLGTLTNNTVSSTNTTVLYNGGASVKSYDYNLKDIITVTATDAACTVTYGANNETRVITTDYDAPVIDLIGEGNRFSGTYQVLVNLGEITTIDGGENPVVINATTQKQIGGIYNYTGTLDERVATTPYSAGTAGTVSNADTYLNAHIGSIQNTVITANGIGIQNGSANATYLPVIDKLGEGLEISANCTTAGYHAVYNTTYAKIGEISGGVYTEETAVTNAYKNNNTDPEQATLISGGDFKGAAATRANAIFEPDNTNRQTYPEGYNLSTGTESVTFHDGSNGEDYFYITKLVEVSFETDGGSVVEAQTVEQGQKLTKPEDPTKEGFTFAGWYKEESCENAWDFENDTVTETMTLYAKWTEGTGFTVKFFQEDGKTQIGEDQTVANGGTVTAPADPTKAATADYTYSFAGWKLRGAEDSTATKTMPAITADTDFVAVFTASAQQYTLQGWSWTGSDTDGYTAATAIFKAAVGDFIKQVSATVTSETTAATCDSAGSTVYTATVAEADSPSGVTVSDSKTVTIPATGHDWNAPTYQWAADNSTVTATRVCKNDAAHVENETVNTSSEVTKPATCEAKGETTYTATFTNAAFETQTKTVENIDATGHDWNEPTYEWAADNSSVTAKRVCKNDASHVETETVNTTAAVTKPATCEAKGETTYTATFTNAAFETQTKTVENIDATGHDWNEPTYEWAADNSTVTATRVCKNDAAHTETETVNTTSAVTKAATCEAKGETTYTATFTNTAFETQTKTVENVEALGHDWDEPTWSWTGTTAVTATFTCKNDSSHVETVTATITSVRTEATCDADGSVIYTATVSFEGKTYTDTKTETLPALGHDWNAPTYQWAADNSTVTAKRVCKHDATHTETETVNATSEVTKPATCEAKGETTYTATFTNTAFATQTKTVENIEATGHDWGEPTYEWAADNSTVTATRVCKNDAAHTETETVNTTAAVTKPATCEAKGETTYTATFTNAAFATQTKTVENIDALGHDWDEPTWSWTGTTAVTATFTCKNDSSHVKTVRAQVTSEQGSGEDYGYTIHTATVTLDGKTYTDIKKSINQYTIIFKDEDGTVLSTVQYDYGTPAASIARPEAPSKAATAQYSYTFAGWTPEIAAVTGDATYTATYTAVTNKYKVTFVDSDGTVLKEETEYEYGTPAAEIQQPEAPSKEATAQFSYRFAGWAPELQAVTADVTYTATYKETLRTYTVLWYDESGKTLLEQDKNVSYGETPRFDGEEPAKAATAEFSYLFTGWKNTETEVEYAKNALPPVQGDVRYSAVFTEERNQYTVRFFDGEQLLQSSELPYGVTPAYSGEPPVKEANAQYSYAFLGWKVKGSQGNTPLEALPAVTGAVDYEAVYSWTVNEYTITWIINGTAETTTVPYGETPAHANPVKAATAQYNYRFTGWEPAIVPVTGDATYTAVFEPELRSYDIVFVDENGTVLDTQTLPYGSTPTYNGKTPVKEANAQYTYSFADWTPAIAEVTGPATYTATYSTETNLYTVTWNDYDGSPLETDEGVPYGTMPSFDGAEPTRAADAQYSYSFAGWTPAVTAVTGNVTYTATYSTTVNRYTVTFVDENGTVLKAAAEYDYGTPAASIVKPADPVKAADAQYTYSFAGWDPVLADVTGNVTYTATYSATVNTYTVTWLPEGGGKALEIDYGVPYGTKPVFEGTVPEKASTAEFDYNFCGWSDGTTVYDPDALPEITGDVSFTAVYTGVKRLYTVTWLNGDGTKLKDIKDIPYGDDLPAYSGDTPTKQATVEFEYVFKEWTTEDTANIGTRTYTEDEVTVTVETVLGNISYTPVFDSQVRSYTVEFRNEDGSVLRTGSQVYGSAIVYGETPEKAQNERYTYRFLGWKLNGGTEILTTLPTVSGEMIFTAAYEPVERTFTVTWLGADGAVLETDTNVPYDTMPSYDSAEPTKAQDEQYTYTFAGWEPEIGPVTQDVTYTARFDAVLRSFTVRFDPCGGTTETETLAVLYGEAVGELPVPTREGGWVFMGWYTAPAATAFDICQGTEVTAETVIKEDTTVYAHWRLPGDVNGDGKVNATDVSLLTTFVKARGKGITIVPFSGDVNGDGKVTSTDVSLLTTFVKARGKDVVLH